MNTKTIDRTGYAKDNCLVRDRTEEFTYKSFSLVLNSKRFDNRRYLNKRRKIIMNSHIGKRNSTDDINERRKRRRTISNDLNRGKRKQVY